MFFLSCFFIRIIYHSHRAGTRTVPLLLLNTQIYGVQLVTPKHISVPPFVISGCPYRWFKSCFSTGIPASNQLQGCCVLLPRKQQLQLRKALWLVVSVVNNKVFRGLIHTVISLGICAFVHVCSVFYPCLYFFSFIVIRF